MKQHVTLQKECVNCGNALSGKQRLYCSNKCRVATHRKRTKKHVTARNVTDSITQPEISWRDQYHQIKGEKDTIKDERDRLLSEVAELRKQTVQLSVERDAALIEKARFEGAYLALSEGKGSIEQVGEAAQSNIVEAKKGKSADTEPIWKRVGRSIKNRF